MKNIFTLPKKILIASNNQGKLVEISDLLKQVNIEAVAPRKNVVEPEETGTTFAQNSLIKAKYYAALEGMTALADDSGLCVEALNGAPGIDSAPFAVDESGKKNFPFAFEKIYAALRAKSVEPNGAKAYFICNLTLFDPQTGFSKSFEGRVDGYLIAPVRGNKGFGYDPLFVKNGMTQSFGEIEPGMKDRISHRANAFAQLKEFLESLYGQS